MKDKKTFWEKLDFVLFVIGAIITIVSIILALNVSFCEGNTDSLYGIIVGFVCLFGLKGLLFFSVLIITILLLFGLIISKINKKVNR
jgi:hypothetical protein